MRKHRQVIVLLSCSVIPAASVLTVATSARSRLPRVLRHRGIRRRCRGISSMLGRGNAAGRASRRNLDVHCPLRGRWRRACRIVAVPAPADVPRRPIVVRGEINPEAGTTTPVSSVTIPINFEGQQAEVAIRPGEWQVPRASRSLRYDGHRLLHSCSSNPCPTVDVELVATPIEGGATPPVGPRLAFRRPCMQPMATMFRILHADVVVDDAVCLFRSDNHVHQWERLDRQRSLLGPWDRPGANRGLLPGRCRPPADGGDAGDIGVTRKLKSARRRCGGRRRLRTGDRHPGHRMRASRRTSRAVRSCSRELSSDERDHDADRPVGAQGACA